MITSSINQNEQTLVVTNKNCAGASQWLSGILGGRSRVNIKRHHDKVFWHDGLFCILIIAVNRQESLKFIELYTKIKMSILLYDNVTSKSLVYNAQEKKIVLTYFNPTVLNLGI